MSSVVGWVNHNHIDKYLPICDQIVYRCGFKYTKVDTIIVIGFLSSGTFFWANILTESIWYNCINRTTYLEHLISYRCWAREEEKIQRRFFILVWVISLAIFLIIKVNFMRIDHVMAFHLMRCEITRSLKWHISNRNNMFVLFYFSGWF